MLVARLRDAPIREPRLRRPPATMLGVIAIGLVMIPLGVNVFRLAERYRQAHRQADGELLRLMASQA